ncbi:MAG TPA: hypothetical protein EYG03_13665 [Planctomycetes bacterium]|nr:hypothetical protein [Fuerstiella sp.]HIK93009.1 hypothetical protein [Planctomycetota bacterium]
MSEDEHINDSVALREIVRAATAIWNQLSEDGRRAETVATPASFAVAESSSSCDSPTSVTLSFPRLPTDVFIDWFGPRLILWPTGVVTARRTSIVSSRVGTRKDLKQGWFDALRTAVIRHEQTECLCYIKRTAAADAVIRASELFGARRLRIDVESDRSASAAELLKWLESKARAHTPSTSALEDVAYVSPVFLADTSRGQRDSNQSGHSAIRDTALVLAGERIVTLYCRSGGKIEKLLARHVQDKKRDAPVLLAAVTESEIDTVSRLLVSLGAVPWLLNRDDADAMSGQTTHSNTGSSQANGHQPVSVSVADGPLQAPEEWLCHWTRPRQGAWIEQPDEEFLDELILGCQTADRSAYAALLRIVEQRQIKASRSVQNAAKTVSFTAVPLGEFRRCRIYRKHKLRFDYEPWGIAIRKAALQKSVCRPVTYVDRTTYDDVSEDDRCFQQLRFDAGHRIDWSQEREWRYVGDLDLSQFRCADVVAFVDTHDEATALQTEAPWRVLQLPSITKPA